MAENARPQVRNIRQSIKADIQQRISAHQSKIAALGASSPPLNLLADGDSWFDYPLIGDDLPLGNSDIIEQLRGLLPQGTLILNLAHHGDATTQMMGVTKRQTLVEQLRAPENGQFNAILFSGGGNDMVGDQFRLWLNDAKLVGGDVAKSIDQQALSDIIGVVMTAYYDLLAARDSKDHSIPIFVHSYDFAWPTNKGVCGFGPWLYPSLNSRGWMQDLGNADMGKGHEIVRLILTEFDKQMRGLSADPHNNVIYVSTQGTLTQPSDWANELHPSPDGFKKIATNFVGPLLKGARGRAAVAARD